jgi:hypothetical protein
VHRVRGRVRLLRRGRHLRRHVRALRRGALQLLQ